MTEWMMAISELEVVFNYYDGKHVLPKYSFRVNSALEFTVSVYGWLLPSDHEIYVSHKRSIRLITILAITSLLLSNKFVKEFVSVKMLPDIQSLFAKNCMMKMIHLFSLLNFTVQGIGVFFTMKNQISALAQLYK